MSASAVAAVQAALHQDREFLIDLTQQLVRIPTVNPKLQNAPGLNCESDLQYYLRAVVDGFGMRTETNEVAAGRPNLIAVLPGDAVRSLILCAHVDVAPVGDRAGWSVEPFAAAIADGRLYGRGALGMKAGLAASVAVARAVGRAGVALDGQLELHALVDGLGGGFGARDSVRRGRRAAGLISPQPTALALTTVRGGRDWVRVTLNGNSSSPEVNAVHLASRFVENLQSLANTWAARQPSHPLLPDAINRIRPGAMQCGTGGGLAGLPVLTNLGMVPDVAIVDFAIESLPNQPPAQIRAAFEGFVLGAVQLDPWLRGHPPSLCWNLHGMQVPPLDTPTEHHLVQTLLDSGATDIVPGAAPVFDAAHYSGVGVPGVLFGPSGAGQYGPDEYVSLDSLFTVADMLAEAAVRWCGAQ